MKISLKHISIIILLILNSQSYSLRKKVSAIKLRSYRLKAVKIIENIAAEAKSGKVPSDEKINELKKLAPYIPKHYSGLKDLLKILPKDMVKARKEYEEKVKEYEKIKKEAKTKEEPLKEPESE